MYSITVDKAEHSDSPYTPYAELDSEVPKNPEESDLLLPSSSVQMTGYVGGGPQVREVGERQSSNRSAVGLVGVDSLQHNCTNSQSAWEKPRDSAPGGFPGRSPRSTTETGV
jgi:hypothetical protein